MYLVLLMTLSTEYGWFFLAFVCAGVLCEFLGLHQYYVYAQNLKQIIFVPNSCYVDFHLVCYKSCLQESVQCWRGCTGQRWYNLSLNRTTCSTALNWTCLKLSFHNNNNNWSISYDERKKIIFNMAYKDTG
jgi:hypothetical protein